MVCSVIFEFVLRSFASCVASTVSTEFDAARVRSAERQKKSSAEVRCVNRKHWPERRPDLIAKAAAP
jgi:hypothetical protein